MSLPYERDLIQSILTMDHPGTFSPEPRQHLRQLLSEILAPHTMICRGAPAGLLSGPSRLNVV
jgi:hypothetical protein